MVTDIKRTNKISSDGFKEENSSKAWMSSIDSVLIRVFKRNKTNRKYALYIFTHTRRFIIIYTSCNYGGWEVPGSAICKLETQESWWYSLKAWEIETQWCRFQSKSEGLKTRKISAPAHAVRQIAKSTFLHLFVLFRPSAYWIMPTHIGEGRLLYSVYRLKC